MLGFRLSVVSGGAFVPAARQRVRMVFLQERDEPFPDVAAQRRDGVTIDRGRHGDQLHRRAGRVLDGDIARPLSAVRGRLEDPAEFRAQGAEQRIERRAAVDADLHDRR